MPSVIMGLWFLCCYQRLYVLAGELALFIEGCWLPAPTGQAAMIPRRVEHTFAGLSDTIRILTIFTPAGLSDASASGSPSIAYRPRP
jgi:hypothetical protein